MSPRKANTVLGLFTVPWLLQAFLLLCWAVDLINWPWWLLWSPVLFWYSVLFLAFIALFVGAFLDGGGERRA